MPNIDIYDQNDHEYVAKDLEFWGLTDALVAHFFPHANHFNQEVYDACCKLGDAWARNEPTEEFEAFLGVTVTAHTSL